MSSTVIKDKETFSIDYSNEIEDDLVLQEIKKSCFSHLNGGNCLKDLPMERISAMYTFLKVKFEELQKLQESLRIQSYSWPLSETSRLIDKITLSDSIYEETCDTSMFLLNKELTHSIDIVSFCYAIINKLHKN